MKTEKNKSESISAKNKVLQAKVFDISGSAIGHHALDKSIFGLPDNPKLVAQYIRVYLQNQRKGTASTLTRAEVNATTKKIYRQKGTGGARHGSKRAPIYVGGGVAGGPKPRDYSKQMNKQQKQLALKVALSLKAGHNQVNVLDGDHAEMKPSTKVISQFLKQASFSKTTLIVLGTVKKNGLVLSSRNISRIDIRSAHTLNAYDVLSHVDIVFAQGALDVINKQYSH